MNESPLIKEWPDARHIYISPHLDDVVLSCGGMIYQQIKAGESVAVITVFAGSAPDSHPLSPFAQSLHDRWQASSPPGIDFHDPPGVRRAEDLNAFSAIDQAIFVQHLHLPECLYRYHPETGEALYASEEAIFGSVQDDDPALILLKETPESPESTLLYLPLSVGGHVDHKVIRRVAHEWPTASSQIRYYAEYPYAADWEEIGRVREGYSGIVPVLVRLEEEAIEAKILAVSEHKSQISTFWDGNEAMAKEVRAYNEAMGGEPLWLYC